MKTILIVDDSPTDTYLLERALSPEFHILSIEHPSQFPSHDTRIDLVVLDVLIPPHQGVETWEMLRKQGYEGPVVIYSGFDTQYIQELFGDVPILPKGLHPKEIRERIRGILLECGKG